MSRAGRRGSGASIWAIYYNDSKYLEMAFDFGGEPIGGIIRNFLLEKSRTSQLSLAFPNDTSPP